MGVKVGQNEECIHCRMGNICTFAPHYFFMYAYLRGNFTYKSPALVHLDVNGVGYELNISLHTYGLIQNLDNGQLYVHFQVKEDAHTLFGFAQQEEKIMFLHLISVSGVGAATARMMLSSLKASEVANAIINNNVSLIESVKGIGKKTAERLVLELKDKMKGLDPGVQHKSGTPADVLVSDACNALMALGINKSQAENAVQKVLKTDTGIVYLEELIKKALRSI